ncbi:MAG TPA: DUF1761 domain-containing protein [Prolixibacteraceae bacterium]|nr:DUF1761 domain-containing protein [Prolixibacteraceae bacterium]
MDFHVNFLAVVLATLSAMVLGSIWYGPLLGKQWMKLNRFTEEDIKKAGPFWKTLMVTLIMYLIASFGLSMYLGENPGISFGAFAGFATAFFWIGTSKFNNVTYEGQSKKLWLLHFGYDVLVYTVMGIIIGAVQ